MAYFERDPARLPGPARRDLALHHADDAVLVEAVVRGTHIGPLRGLPPTGRSYELPFLGDLRVRGRQAGLRARLLRLRTRCCGSSASPATRSASPAASARLLSHPLTIGRGLGPPGHRALTVYRGATDMAPIRTAFETRGPRRRRGMLRARPPGGRVDATRPTRPSRGRIAGHEARPVAGIAALLREPRGVRPRAAVGPRRPRRPSEYLADVTTHTRAGDAESR